MSEALVEDLIKDDLEDNTGANIKEGAASDLKTVDEGKGDDEEKEEDEELPKITDAAGGSSEPEIVGEKGGIEVISEDPNYDMYKCPRCAKVFKTERDMSKHYRSDHTRVENRIMLAEVKAEGNYRAGRMRVMEEAREEQMAKGRKELREREEELARTRRCEVGVKKIRMATVKKGGPKRTPPKSKKRRATESSTDEEKTPKIKSKKLKGEEAQKQDTPKPRQASAANPDNRGQGRMPLENVAAHVERALETIRPVGAWMEAARKDVWTEEGGEARWDLKNLVVEEGNEPGVQATTSAIGGASALQMFRAAERDFPEKMGIKDKGANWTTKVKEMTKYNKFPDGANVIMMQGLSITQAAVRVITKAFESGVRKMLFKDAKCIVILGHEGMEGALGGNENKVQAIKMEVGATGKPGVRPEILEGNGDLTEALQDGSGVYAMGALMLCCPGKPLCLGECKGKQKIMSALVIGYQEDKCLGGALMMYALTTLSAMPEDQKDKTHKKIELWVSMGAKAQVGYPGMAERKSSKVMKNLLEGMADMIPENKALKTTAEIDRAAAFLEMTESACQDTYERATLKQRIVLYNRELKEKPVRKEGMSLEEMETALMGLTGSTPVTEERVTRGKGKVLVSYQPWNEYAMVRDGLTGEVDTIMMDEEDWIKVNKGEIIGKVEPIPPRGKEPNQRAGATDLEKISFFGESSQPTEEDEKKSRGEINDDRRSTLTGGEKDIVLQELMREGGINKPGWNREGTPDTFGEGVRGGYCRHCKSCKRNVCKEEGINPKCGVCQTVDEGKKGKGCQTGCQNRPPCPEKAPAAFQMYTLLGERKLDSVIKLLGKDKLDTAEKVDLLDSHSVRKKRANPEKAGTVRKEETAVTRLSEIALGREVASIRSTLGPQMDELARERMDELARFNDTSEKRMGIVRKELPVVPEEVTPGKFKKKLEKEKRRVVLAESSVSKVGGKRHYRGEEEGRGTREDKKKQKVNEHQEGCQKEDSEIKTIRYVDSTDEEKDERKVSLQDTPERESGEIPDGTTARNVVIVETSQEGTSDEDQWKPDREVVLRSSGRDEEDLGLKTGNREDSSESTNGDRRTMGVEVHSTTADSTLQEIAPRRVKEGDFGIDDEMEDDQADEDIPLQEIATRRVKEGDYGIDDEMEDDQADEDIPLVEEAVYEEQSSDDDENATPAEDLELAEEMEKGFEVAQSKEEKMMGKNLGLAKYVRVGLAEAVRRLPLPIEGANKKKEDDDVAHYSQEEQREREAQKEKERAEAMREENRAKGSSSVKRNGQPKAKGGSPSGADDL